MHLRPIGCVPGSPAGAMGRDRRPPPRASSLSCAVRFPKAHPETDLPTRPRASDGTRDECATYDRVAVAVADALPKVSSADRVTLVHEITAGNLSGATLAGHDVSSLRALATVSFASGYHALFLAGALFMLVSTVLTWCLVSPAETPPIPASSARPQSKPQ